MTDFPNDLSQDKSIQRGWIKAFAICAVFAVFGGTALGVIVAHFVK
jgi:hypothetical protein